MNVTAKAYARAGLMGNPSDGYFGKTIAITVKNFFAQVNLKDSDSLNIIASEFDAPVYKNIEDLIKKIDLYGFYGGIRLVKAAIRLFTAYCCDQHLVLHDKNFSLSYDSSIPRQLGLGGSSAIITAVFRALMDFYHISIPLEILPTLILKAERDELRINAGFMDRVIQVHEGCFFMDFNREVMEKQGYGVYERIDPKLLPSLYLAYKPELGKVSGQVLNDIRLKYDQGDRFVIKILKKLMSNAEAGRKAILEGNRDLLNKLMDNNFDLRSRIMNISEENLQMIRTARACGASAKFAGSGGSIIGAYSGEEMFLSLINELDKIDAVVIKPIID
jgi:glucuronokinase